MSYKPQNKFGTRTQTTHPQTSPTSHFRASLGSTDSETARDALGEQPTRPHDPHALLTRPHKHLPIVAEAE